MGGNEEAGIQSVDQFADKTESELLGLHGMGPKALDQLHRVLVARGRSFADEKEAG